MQEIGRIGDPDTDVSVGFNRHPCGFVGDELEVVVGVCPDDDSIGAGSHLCLGAIRALGRLKAKEALSSLERIASKDESEYVRLAAKAALFLIGRSV